MAARLPHIAGALQDHKRATLVGTGSFGKSSVLRFRQRRACAYDGALFHPSGRSIQARGIVPDIEVAQDVPKELKSGNDTNGEAALPGHLKSEGDEKTASQSYVPPDPKDDKALKTATDLLHGLKVNTNGETAAIDKPAVKMQ